MSNPCILCNNSENNSIIAVKELQLGLGEVFDYQQCGNCGSVQLQTIPGDFGKYYPNDDYYSFNLGITIAEKADSFRKLQSEHLLFGKNNFLGSLATIGFNMPDYYQWMKNTRAQYDDAILDIGTGNGSLLTRLHRIGYTNLTGIDPFISESKDYGAVKILKKDVFAVSDRYDVVMMHHSLEHMFEPKKVLAQLLKVLKPGGRLLIRIPVMGNYGWKKYVTYWCGIDAPRHIFVPTEKALKLMLEEAGFEIERFEYDSSDYVIWSSEQYLKGMPLHDPKSQMVNPKESMFSKGQIKEFRKLIQAENKKGNGDTAAIYLRKK
ncbi:MAG: class I SAM-dependent methyltransferase [Ferruginibacter sp.]|nr:class I SAM-dependent methyltransferase [Ferruginibacter sp.]